MKSEIISYSTMTWPEVEAYIKKKPYALLPIGSEEEHGYHMPMGVDSMMGQYYAEEVSKRTGLMVLPIISYSVLFSLRRFPGTLYLENETFINQLLDLAKALESHGFKYIYLVLGHHGASGACINAERSLITNNSSLRFIVLNLPENMEVINNTITAKRWHRKFFHAEEIETSMMLAVFPHLVNMEKAVSEYPKISPLMGSISDYWDETCKSGVFGDATAATPEKGKILVEAVIQRYVEIIENHQKIINK